MKPNVTAPPTILKTKSINPNDIPVPAGSKGIKFVILLVNAFSKLVEFSLEKPIISATEKAPVGFDCVNQDFKKTIWTTTISTSKSKKKRFHLLPVHIIRARFPSSSTYSLLLFGINVYLIPLTRFLE